MASLFIVGNTNEYTFANAALAACVHERELGGAGLGDVFVLHSPESERHLTTLDTWKQHLAAHGLSPEVFVSATVDLRTGGTEQLSRVAHHIERFLLALNRRDDVYVDLTNGNSLYKSVMSNIAYVLGVRRQFILETPVRGQFLSPEHLRSAYVELPEPALLDSVAPAWLTEVRRFSVSAKTAAQVLVDICGADAARRIGFEGDIENAVLAWFKGAKLDDGAALGGAVRYVGRAFEDLIQGVHDTHFATGANQRRTLNDRIAHICAQLKDIAPEYEPQLMDDISQLLKRLRNESTHERTTAEFGRIRARLSTELLLATSDYLKILHRRGLLARRCPTENGQPATKCSIEGTPGQSYYFGLDGDDTGRELERLFQGGFDADSFAKFSSAVSSAIDAVARKAKDVPVSGTVLFASGDDVLFTGKYHAQAIEELRKTYNRLSGGRTCSIGFGVTPKEAYIALKMAKASPGKDTIVGVQVVRT